MTTRILPANLNALQKYHPYLLEKLNDHPPQPQTIMDEYQQDHSIPPPDELTESPPAYRVFYGAAQAVAFLKHFNHPSPFNYRNVLIEPSLPHFHYLLTVHDLSAFLNHPASRLIVEETDSLETTLREDLAALGAWGPQFHVNLETASQHTDHFQQCLDILNRITGLAYENARVQIRQGSLIQENVIRNFPWILRSQTMSSYTGQFSGTPAIIIGAGPSLDTNIKHLKHAPPGALLIATDTALRPLVGQGIQPHIVVTCDPSPLNHKHVEAINSLGTVLLAYLPETHHAIMKQFAMHPFRLCLHDWQSKLLLTMKDILGTPPAFQRGMNVGFCAFSLARQMGCAPLILVGMDLAVSPGKRSHAQGTATASDLRFNEDGTRSQMLGQWGQSDESPMIEVEGYHGGTVKTFTHFYHALRLFEREIANTPAPVIDCTEGGARKPGAVQQPLAKTLSELPATEPAASRLKAIALQPKNALPYKKFLKPHYLNLLSHQQNIQKAMQQLATLQRSLETATIDPQTALTQLDDFQHRFDTLLMDPALDVALDIALAPVRFGLRRAISPAGLTPNDLALWRVKTLYHLMSQLAETLSHFISLYKPPQRQ